MLKKIIRRPLALLGCAAALCYSGFSAAQTLVSQNMPVVASSSQQGLTPAAAVDGNTGTRWGSNFTDAEWIYVDLGKAYKINRVLLNWEAAYGRGYQVQVSDNATSWTTIYSTTTGDGGTDDLSVSGQGRYVRINGTARATGYGYSLWEYQVYGIPVTTSTLLSQNAPVVASSQEGGFAAVNAVDGNTGTRWGSNFTDAEWIYVDLGSKATINRVLLNWEAAYGRSYQIQVSDNASSWTTIYSTTSGDGGTDDLTVSGQGRYVRFNGQARATAYGYSLWELQVYGARDQVVTSSSTSSRTSSSTSTSTSTSESTSSRTSTSSSSSSKTCDQLPGAVSNLTATGITSTSLTLSWTAATPCVDGYRIYKDNQEILSTKGTSTVVIGLNPSTPYTFKVVAYAGFGASAQSASIQVTTAASSGNPDFGANVQVFDTSMNTADIQNKINAIFSVQQNNQFGTPRTAIMFKPGTYNIDIPVGFFTHVIGLGSVPDQVKIASIRSEPILPNNNATQNFWRGLENLAAFPQGGMRWAVSQAVPFRRIHVLNNNISLHASGGWASGGWMSDSKIDFDVSSGSQQQWISRNTEWGSWTGNLWNMVFVGIPNNLPGGTWPTAANTFVDSAPVVREKPFLYLNGNNYEVFVPALKTNSKGISWAAGIGAGTSVSLENFYIAHAGVDSASSINSALSQGKHLLLTPGIYDLTDTIRVTRADTIVMGMGFATLHPTTGKTAISVADVDGVKLAHLFVDAGLTNSPVLVEVGPSGSNASHASNPTSVSDVFVRVGGNGATKATVSMQINSNDVIIDHTWLWRADHGDGAGWNSNTARNGLVVNGNNVTAYGLFVEHFQQYQVLWNGNNGRTYFYQSEIPYDPPTQADFTSGAGVNGWASYKVADTVTNHEAWGLGIYAVFLQPNVFLSRAIEVPNTPNVKFHHMVTVNLTNNGAIQNVINNTGGSTAPGIAVNTPRVTDYPAQ